MDGSSPMPRSERVTEERTEASKRPDGIALRCHSIGLLVGRPRDEVLKDAKAACCCICALARTEAGDEAARSRICRFDHLHVKSRIISPGSRRHDARDLKHDTACVIGLITVTMMMMTSQNTCTYSEPL